MRKLRTICLWCMAPILVCLVLTVIGIVIHSVSLIAISGFVLFFICFWLFALADRILEFFKSAHSKYRQYLQARSQSSTDLFILQFIDLLGRLPIRFAIVIRAASLSLSFWLVGFYVSLCGGGLQTFFGDWKLNLLKTVLAMTMGIYDSLRGKTIANPGLPTRGLSIWGAFNFIKNLILLLSAVHSVETLKAMKGLFSTPIWFLDPYLTSAMLRFSGRSLLGVLFFFLIFPLFGIVQALYALKASPKPDAKNFNIAALAIFCWLLSLPIFVIYILVSTK